MAEPAVEKKLNESDRARSKKSNDDEFGLIRAAQRGEEEAFGELVKRYQQKIYALAYSMTGNHSDADDLAQETFLKAYRALGRFRFKSKFYTWIYRIAINTIISELKKSRKHSHLELEPQWAETVQSPYLPPGLRPANPRRELRRAELREVLHRALDKLTDKHRAVVTMHDIEGIPQVEIARILSCSEGTIRSRLHYARRQLQGLLKVRLE